MSVLKHFTLLITLTVSMVLVSVSSTHAQQQFDEDCFIWLCASEGFNDPECSVYETRFMRRVSSGHAPLPAYNQCSTEGSGVYKIGSCKNISSGLEKHICSSRPVEEQNLDHWLYIKVDGQAYPLYWF